MLQVESEDPLDSPEVEVLRAALDSYSGRYGPHHPLVIDVVERLAAQWWREGSIGRAVSLLAQTLQSLPGADSPGRRDLLGILWKIMFEQRKFELASEILREVYESCLREHGPLHPDSLATQGDLSFILFHLGGHTEAAAIGLKALESARTQLGKTDRVTCILAWNRVMLCERSKDPEAARDTIVSDLLWLLAEDQARLDPDLREIREWLIDRFEWNSAPAC